MKRLSQGTYLGINKSELLLDGLILSETIYHEELSAEWHTHNNPYFAFILNGGCEEQRSKESLECIPGKLFFYNWEEPHCNRNYQLNSKMFNVELSYSWLNSIDLRKTLSGGVTAINNPTSKFLLLKIIQNYRQRDNLIQLEIETLTVQLISSLTNQDNLNLAMPRWAINLKEILHECWQENFSLKELSEILKIHPVTISKYFPRYFNSTLGEYIRKIKIDKSLTLIKSGNENLASIAYQCGFSDQSHFIKVFKKETGLLPHHYKSF